MPKPIERKICQPPDFNGDREESTKFLRLVTTYLDINDEIYDTDRRMIAFALSFMKTGPAGVWMEDFLTHAQSVNPLSTTGAKNGYGTWEDFVTKFKECFEPIDSAGTALHRLHSLKQGDDLSAHVATFRQLCSKAGITNYNAVKDYFLRGLKPGLMAKLCNSGDIPDNFDALVRKVISIENAYQLLLSHRSQSSKPVSKKPSRFTPSSSRDPNAMDVDRLTEAEKKEHMRTGKCFRCHKAGHRANDPEFHPKEDRKNDKGKKPVRRTAPEEETSKIEDLDDDEETRRVDF